MIDPPIGRPSFEATPTRVGARGPGRALLVVGVAVALVVIALLKPWGGGDELRTAVASAPAAPAPTPAAASVGPARSVDPAFDIALAGRSPDVDGRAPGPARVLGDPVSAAATVVADVADRADGWGIGPDGGTRRW
jgi:hypothetical protein